MHASSRPSARPQHRHAPLHAPNVAPLFCHLLDRRFKAPNILAIWMVQRTTKMPENMKETAACGTLSWPLPLCVKDALQHHKTSARLASTGRSTARSPTHLTAHKARANGHQIILGHGRRDVLVARTTKVLSRDAGASRGASGDLLVQEARSSPPALPPSLPSAWSLPARNASHSTSSLAPVSRSPSASSLADDSTWPLLCPSRTDGARASWRRAHCLWAHDGKMVLTPHSVEHLVYGRSTEQ